jgi:hypothetical protein
MDPTELTKLYNMNKKQLLLNLINILKPTTKNVKKGKKKKVFKTFSYLNMLYRALKQVTFTI